MYDFLSQGSSSVLVKNMLQIEDKVSMNSDDRYYVLGMAEAMVLDKIDAAWQEKVLQKGLTLEECLINIIQSTSSTNR